MPLVELGSRALYYERRGSGAPLLLIQGMAGHHALWGEPFLNGLTDVFDVVTYDHRGIGDSLDPTGADFTILDLAQDAVALLDALGWATANVMGISMGGMVAQELALNHRDRVRALVLGCTYCGGEGSTLAATGPTRMLAAMNTHDVDVSLRAAYSANLSPTFTAEESHYEPFRRTSVAVRVPVPIVLRQAAAAFAHDTSARLPSLRASTLVLHGTADEMLDHVNGEMIAALVPGATLHSFDDVGHLFWWEQPRLTAELVRRHCGAA